MEKPAAYDGYRIRERSLADHNLANVMHDRMMLRDARSQQDSEESDEHTWRGDHSFSADAAAYSLSNFIEPEVKKKHPDWTSERVHEEAMNQFEKRLQQDLTYEKRETIHEETTVRWEIRETSPGVKELATRYGDDYITLRELWDHTREFAEAANYPDGYNAEEAKAQLAMEEAFIRGEASGFVSVLSHPDAVRYVQIWEPTATGEILSKQIDLYSTTGRDFSAEESVQLIEHVAEYQGTSEVSIRKTEESTYAHFFVSSGTRIREEDIRTIAVAESYTYERSSTRVSDKQRDVQNMSIVRTISHDMIDGTRDLITAFGAYLDKKIHASTTGSSVEHVTSSANTDIRKMTDISTAGMTWAVISETHPSLPTHTQPDTNVFLEITNVSKADLDRARHIPVGPIAFLTLAAAERGEPQAAVGPLALHEEISLDETKTQHVERHVIENQVVRELLTFWDLIVHGVKRPDGKKVTEQHSLSSIPTNPESNSRARLEAAKNAGDQTFMNMLSLLSIFFRESVSIQSPRFMPERTVRIRTSVRADSYVRSLPRQQGEAFSAMTKRLEHVTGMPDILHETIDHLPFTNIERGIGTLMFAYVLYMEAHRKPSVATDIPQPEDTKDLVKGAGQETEGKETFPWILLAIIWQLSMIREMGKSQHADPTKKPPTSKMKTAVSDADRFPDHGVIFLAVLHDRMKYIAAAQADTRLFIYG